MPGRLYARSLEMGDAFYDAFYAHEYEREDAEATAAALEVQNWFKNIFEGKRKNVDF